MAKSDRVYHIIIIALLLVLVGLKIHGMIYKESYFLPSKPLPSVNVPYTGSVTVRGETAPVTIIFSGLGQDGLFHGTIKNDARADLTDFVYNDSFLATTQKMGNTLTVADPFQTHGFMTYVMTGASLTITIQNLTDPNTGKNVTFQVKQ